MRLPKSRVAVLASAAAATVASAAFAAPAAAAAAPDSTCTYAQGTLCFWNDAWLAGDQVQYSAPLGSACVNTPIDIHGWLNMTDRSVQLYRGAGCTGYAITVPVTDLHTSLDAYRSFKTAG